MSVAPRTYPPRLCPGCLAVAPKLLFQQRFSAFSDGALHEGYDLVCCERCGAAYADNIPEQLAFDQYYAEMSKYENNARLGESSPTEEGRYAMVADVLERIVPREARIVDVGCATGGLLGELKGRGFSRLEGIDPSATCVQFVRERYGVAARIGTIAAMRELEVTPDVVLLIGVMEHLRDVDAALEHVSAAVAADGAVYIEVPDAARSHQLPGAPYQLISYEHINYFSRISLANLMSRHGYEEVFFEANVRALSPSMAEPAFSALYRGTTRPETPLVCDNLTERSLRNYLARSAEAENRIHAKIVRLVDQGVPIAVWGTGTHTLRLLETSPLVRANIVAFIDSNPRYQGKTLAGRPVVAPTAFDPTTAEILISSPVAEEDIYRFICDQLRWNGPVHRLYGASAR